MSDLCHNCGDCHLGAAPTPCLKNIHLCQICQCYGHTYNFCPMSVRQVDENYLYWMLCHNCDKWHLPNPCPVPYEQCDRCGNLGHINYFCPIDPKPRTRPGLNALNAARVAGPCRLPHLPCGITQFPVTRFEHCSPELLAMVRASAVTDALHMLNSGLSPHQVAQWFMSLSQPHATPSTGLPAPQEEADMASHPTLGDQVSQPMQHHHAFPQQPVDSRNPRSPEQPAPKRQRRSTLADGANTDESSVEPTLEHQQAAGDQSIVATVAAAMAAGPGSPAADGNAGPPLPAKSASKRGATVKRKTSATRCAGCAKLHKRCSHLNKNNDPQSREQSVGTPQPSITDAPAPGSQLTPDVQVAGPEQAAARAKEVDQTPNFASAIAAAQTYDRLLTPADPLQPHEQAELDELLGTPQQDQRQADAATHRDRVAALDEGGNAADWAAGGGGVQETTETVEVAEAPTTTKAAPKKRVGHRKKG